jgi:hypothetical protein
MIVSTSLGYGAANVAKSTLLQKEFTPHQRATMGSLNSFGGSLVFGVMAIGLGLVADKLTPAIAIVTTQLLLLGLIPLQWKLFQIENGKRTLH